MKNKKMNPLYNRHYISRNIKEMTIDDIVFIQDNLDDEFKGDITNNKLRDIFESHFEQSLDLTPSTEIHSLYKDHQTNISYTAFRKAFKATTASIVAALGVVSKNNSPSLANQIIARWQNLIPTLDLSTQDVPVGFSFATSGKIVLKWSQSESAVWFDSITDLAEFINNWINENFKD